MTRVTHRPRGLGRVTVLGLCALSLAGWGPLRGLEQWAAFALRPGEWILGGVAAAPPEIPDVERRERERAAVLYPGYERAVAGERLVAPGLLPVVERRPQARQLVVAGTEGALAPGAAVTWRDVLVGRVGEIDGGRAVVDLLAHRRAGAVAGEWRVSPDAPVVHFLARGDGETLQLERRSSAVRPPDDEVAFTRDVRALGGTLPSGLVVGRLRLDGTDRPGGGDASSEDARARLELVVDPMALHVVAVAGAEGTMPAVRRVEARAYAVSGDDGALRLDRGSRDGVARGDWVAQDGAWVGEVARVGPRTAVVERRAPPGILLVLSDDGRLVPATAGTDGWPAHWHPGAGDRVFAGTPASGGVFVGWVDEVRERDFTLRLATIDRSGVFTVAGS